MAREIAGGPSQSEAVTADGSGHGALDYEQMNSAEVMEELGRINLDYARRGLLWGEPNTIQTRYIALNKTVHDRKLWGDQSNRTLTPIARTQAALK